MDDESLQRVEKQRIELENNIAKLKKALRHWQTLEIDYEALREEFLPLPEHASLDQCFEAAKESGADLIDEKELRTLITDDKGRQRRPSQVIDLLSKRVDYVTRNVSTLRKQLSDAEKKRNALLLVENPDFREDAALPLAEITEELDEEGKVLSSKVEHPGKGTSKLSKVLQKAGVEVVGNETNENSTTADKKEIDNPDLAQARLPQATQPNSSNLITDASTAPTKKLTTKIEQDAPTEMPLLPINPNDSEDDAKLRQDMLRYGLDEVGAIVAELEVDDNEDEVSEEEEDFEDDDSNEDEDDDDNDDEEESEDESGRTKRPLISNKYRQKMQEMEKSLGITDLKNLGPSPDVPPELRNQIDRPSAAEAARKAAIAREEAAKSSMKSVEADEGTAKKRKQPAKKVAFASSLDIASDLAPKQLPSTQPIQIENLPERPRMKPVGESVVERANTEETSATSAPAPETKKTSKFKAARSEIPQTPMYPPPMDFPETKAQPVPEGPPGRTIADALVEREGIENASIAPAPDSADFDEEMHKREVAEEYYKMRNRKIHEQGGYVGDGELDNYGEEYTAPVIEDEATGKRRKVSRFKAARMKSHE